MKKIIIDIEDKGYQNSLIVSANKISGAVKMIAATDQDGYDDAYCILCDEVTANSYSDCKSKVYIFSERPTNERGKIFKYQKITDIIGQITDCSVVAVENSNCINDEFVNDVNVIRSKVTNSFSYDDNLSPEQIREMIISTTNEYCDKNGSRVERNMIINHIYNAMCGYDVLQEFLSDPTVTEIMVNGYRDIFYEKNGSLNRSDISFLQERDLENLIQKIVSTVNRSVNESNPIVDARLSGGERVNVVLPPVSLNGPTLTIRKFPEHAMTMQDLIGLGSVTEQAADFLKKLVKAKYNIFISGGTGSGKTTFLNALSDYIPEDERIITIEDSAELKIERIKNLVRMEKRNSNTEGLGEISIRDLIKTSLRMRPERIIVGEVRGAEALDMLQAMNTGHDGSISTGHANSSSDMIRRLETMVLTGANMPLDAIRSQITGSIDYIIHLSRLRDKTRRTMEISEVIGYKNGDPVLNPIYIFEEKEFKNGKIKGGLIRTPNCLTNVEKFISAGIEIPGREENCYENK